MPQRRTVQRLVSTEAQGEDSYVVIRPLTVGEMETLQAQRDKQKLSDMAFGKLMAAQKIADWNWVDDDGAPLPKPSDDPTVMDRLNEYEVAFLTRAVSRERELKN